MLLGDAADAGLGPLRADLEAALDGHDAATGSSSRTEPALGSSENSPARRSAGHVPERFDAGVG